MTVTVTNPNNVPLTGVNDTVYPAPGAYFIVALLATPAATMALLSVSYPYPREHIPRTSL